MGTFEALTMLGIFPNPGQNVYFITPTFFESISIRNGVTGKTATIKNINFDPSGQNVFIQSAKLNGQPYTKNWLQHSFFLEGGTLELTLGATESGWGTRSQDVPPSLGPFGNGNSTLPGNGTSNGTRAALERRGVMPRLDLDWLESWR